MSKSSKLSKLSKLSLLTGLLVLIFLVAQAQAAGNAILSLVKDKSSGLFILNMRDSQGIKSFSIVFPTDKLPYSGDLNGCPQSRKIDNITINDPSDFAPSMNAVILDCQGNETEFEIGAPKDGVAQVKKAGIEPPPAPPTSRPSGTTEGTAPASQEATQGKPSSSEASSAGGEPLAAVQYPIKELGNCANQDACKTYCERPENIEKCVKFAEENNLLSSKELEKGKKFAAVLKTGGGPGGCKTEKSCFEYCNNVDQIDECVKFAEDNGFMEKQELDEAKKIQSIVRSGKNLPGNCKNRTACEAYCKNSEHLDECIAFAKENGMMSEEELKEVEKFLPLIKSGQTPGKCKSKEECEAFCEAEANFDECFAFAEKAGLISEKEREIMKKTGGKGPGGCRGRACQTFCDNPANQKACFEFGKQYGLISDADLQRMEEGKRMLKEQLETGPPEIQECLKSVVDVNVLESDEFMGGPELGEKMRACFEKLIPEGMKEQFEFGPGGEFHGPGGCKSREECEAYCTANPEACGFGGGSGGGGGGPGGGGGCTNKEECVTYCTAHYTDPACASYIGSGGGGGGTGGGGSGGGSGAACPEMLSRTSCDAGEERFVTYQSEGCGTYFGCRPASGGGGTTGGFSGPGGCTSQATCTAYCQTNYTDPACVAYVGGVACPEDLKLCPGGGYVGRTAPKCEFAECPISPPPPPPPPPTQSCAPPPSGLVSWWNGNSLSGAAKGGVAIAPDGKVGNAFKFNGSGSINMGNPANLNFGTGPFSLEAWFYWSSNHSASANNIIRKSNYPTGGPGSGYWLRAGGGQLEFSVGATTGPDGQSIVVAPINTDIWYHAVGTKDSSGNIKLYINGREQGVVLRQALNTESTSDDPFTIGSWRDVTEFFSGLIDEVSVYNRALSASEVQAIFNAGSAGKCSNSSSNNALAPFAAVLAPFLELLK